MPQATPFDSILAQCRDMFCERLASALSGMLDKSDEALSSLINESRDTEAQKLYRETLDKLHAQREMIETQFRARYLREFQQRSNRAKKIGGDLEDEDLPSIELALVGDDDLDETLKFNAMTARLRQYCDEELVALDQRVGVLFGDADLQPDDNPFTPQAICDAYKQTCSQVDSNVEVRMVLLKLFDEFVLDDIRGIYRAVNALLVQNSILPKLRGMGSARKERAKTPAPAEKAGEQDFFALLQGLVTQNVAGPTQTGAVGAGGPGQGIFAMPGTQSPGLSGTTPVSGLPGAVPAAGVFSAAVGSSGVPQVFQGEELMRSLTRVQLGDVGAVTGNTLPLVAVAGELGTTNVLRELKATNLGSGMSQMDAMTLDIVALLFDQLFDDPKIPIGVKGLIGRLQIPILKVAIADKAFFSKKTHPARQMLDTLGEIAARLPADVSASNPAFGRMDKILQELLEGFENDIEIFDVVREKLQTLLTEEDQRIEEEAQSTEKQIEQKESLALAKTVAQTEIRVRLRGRRVPRPVLEFLLRQWIKVLLLVQVKEGESSETWKHAIETMDLLIWSVEPKNTLEARRELVDKVPELLRRLVDALKSADIEDAVRSRFIVDLRKLHSEVIASAGTKKAAVPEEASPSIADTPVDSAAPVLSPAIEIGPETAAPPAESVPSLEPTAIEFTPAIAAPPAESAPPLEMPSIDFGFLASAAPGETVLPQEPHAKEAVPAIALVPPDSAPPVETAPAAKQADRPGPKFPDKQPAPVASGPVEAETLDMSAPVTVTNPFGGGEVEVGDLDFTVQSPSVPTGDKPAPAIPATFVVGTWVAIVRKGEKVERQLARLAFITPLKTRYLFVDRYGKPALECSQTELFRLFRLGEVTITNETVEMPLFDRIVAGLASKLSERR